MGQGFGRSEVGRVGFHIGDFAVDEEAVPEALVEVPLETWEAVEEAEFQFDGKSPYWPFSHSAAILRCSSVDTSVSFRQNMYGRLRSRTL